MSMPGAVRRIALVLAASLAAGSVASEPLPAPPRRQMDDRAGLLPAEAAARLEDRLRAFRARTGHEVVVSIFPTLPSPSLEDFTVRTAQAWRIGRKGLDDGVVLFVFVKERRLRLEVGYGLEDKVPDAIARRILDEVMVPPLRAGRSEQAIEEGVDAVFAAVEGRPLPKPADPEVAGDVPVPPEQGLTDDAHLLDAPGKARAEEALAAFVKDTSCRLAVVILPGRPADHSSYHGEDTYAYRSFFRANPKAPGQSDDDYFKGFATVAPNGLLFVFVEGHSPLVAKLAYAGTSSCAAEKTVGNILPGLTLEAGDPAGGLVHVIEILGQIHAGTYTPPPPLPPPPPSVADRVFGHVRSFAAGVNAYTYAHLPLGWAGLLFGFSAFVALPVRSGAIRRRMRGGRTFPTAWMMESVLVFGWFVAEGVELSLSSGGRGRSSGSSGSTGGGGSFGGGGASGSW